jgi:acetoin utilization deacetylase AcuC-like enzyme
MTVIISHPDCLLHNSEIQHPECPERLRVISKALSSAKLEKNLSYEEAPLVTREQLYRAHDKKYIEGLLNLTTKEGPIYLDPDTIITPYTFSAALRSAGAVVKAVDLLMSNQAKSAFCNIRPPGHHAEHNRAMGFCFFNNLAVGVAHALHFHKLKRIAIIDFDAHRGNGTEDIFFNNNQVLICSIYEENLYPFDVPRQAKNIINIPLPARATGREFRAEITQHGLEKIDAFKPQIMFFSAGFDGHVQDPISNLNLTEFDYLWLTQQIKRIADTHSQGKMVSVLEGGYDLASLGQCVVAHINGLID